MEMQEKHERGDTVTPAPKKHKSKDEEIKEMPEKEFQKLITKATEKQWKSNAGIKKTFMQHEWNLLCETEAEIKLAH